ncbi:MAG TPA: hypothetical protein VGX78_05970, partial [Pirellulales bacterium]|nr:hypothetical protein [Pirellulales bacterium]
SPELDLLGRLAANDLPLSAAVALFPRIDLAKKAVEVCVRSQAAELVCKQAGKELVVQPWRLRFLLNDPGTWRAAADGSAVYHLRITPDAQGRYVADGGQFVRDLFQAYAR